MAPARELRTHNPADKIAIGTGTDPYQPIARTARITRSLLDVLVRYSGLRIGVVTKSRLIERDIDLLVEVNRRNTLVLHLTITLPDAALARILEPRAPRPDLRFAAVRTLRTAGLTPGILCSPLLPGFTDTPETLDAMASRVLEARASFFATESLFLKSCSRPTFLSFVRLHFPHLTADYKMRFATEAFASAPYRNRLAALVHQACRRHGLSPRSTDALLTLDTGVPRKPAVSPPAQAQRQLLA